MIDSETIVRCTRGWLGTPFALLERGLHNQPFHHPLNVQHERSFSMNTLAWLITGGFARGYRTQVLGVTAALRGCGRWATCRSPIS